MSLESASVASRAGVLRTSTPYPWPYHGRFDPAQTVLVACLDGWWRAPGPEAEAADARLVAIADALRRAGGSVIAITQCAPRRRLPRRAGMTVPLPLAADEEVKAGATSAFYGSTLEDLLLEHGSRPDLIVAGWGLEGPVHSTLRAANDRGFECLLVVDASVPVDGALAANARSMVEFSGGIFGAVGDSADLVALLVGHFSETDL